MACNSIAIGGFEDIELIYRGPTRIGIADLVKCVRGANGHTGFKVIIAWVVEVNFIEVVA